MSRPSEDSADKSVRVALVGCGAITMGMHLPAVLAIPGAEVTAFCDRRTDQAAEARRLSGRPDAVVVGETRELQGRADAAIVAVPSRLHAPVTIELLRMGIDVLCEKPIAATVADADAMIQAARDQDRLLAVGLVSRFNPNNRLFSQMLADGVAGEIQRVVVEWGTMLDWEMTSDAYFNKATMGGGVLFDFGIHGVDRVLWLFGDLTDIDYADDSYGGVECNARLHGTLTIAGRPVPCDMEFSWTHGLPGRITVVGRDGSIEMPIADPDGLSLIRSIGGTPTRFDLQTPRRSPNPFLLQMRDFVEAVRHRRAPFVTGESAARSLAVVERAYASRKPLSMPWVEANGTSA